MRRLVDAGAVIDSLDDGLRTPLHWAAEGGDNDTVVVLLEAGADPTADSVDGAPIDLAERFDNEQVVETLENWTG